MVFEPLGKSLLDYIILNNYEGFPSEYLYPIAHQILLSLHFLKSKKLIHTDLKLENILFLPGPEIVKEYDMIDFKGRTRRVKFRLPDTRKIKLIDFGGATYNDQRKTNVINTRQYRGPEVTLELGWGYPSDAWSAGCIIAELMLGELLFSTHDNLEHLAMMEYSLGNFPDWMVKNSRQGSHYFDDSKRGT